MTWIDYFDKYISPWMESDTDAAFDNACVVIFVLIILFIASAFIIIKNDLKDGLKHYWETSEVIRRPSATADTKKTLALLYISMPMLSTIFALLFIWYVGIPIIWILLKCCFNSAEKDDEAMQLSTKERIFAYFLNPVLPYLILALLMLFGVPYKLIP